MSDRGRNTARWLVLGIQGVLVAALGAGIAFGWFPLGVPGEWEWLRVPFAPEPTQVVLAGLVVLTYAVFSAVGMRSLGRGSTRPWNEGTWLVALFVVAVCVQGLVPGGAPTWFGLTRWVSLAVPGTSGYHTAARQEIDDPWRFWAEYPEWIRWQDSLHIGTHPPGLLLWSDAACRLMEGQPEVVDTIAALTPETVAAGFREIAGPTTRAERAAIVLTAVLTWLVCSATVFPLYALARASLTAPMAFAVASLWPLVPSAILFQPGADTAYPFLSASALALVVWATRRRRGGIVSAAAAGLILGFGMQLTLAFLAVGLIVALTLFFAEDGVSARFSRAYWSRRGVLLISVGAGFVAFTLGVWAISAANPLVIWWWNQANHARFYDEYPRTYLAWVAVNPIELAVGIGIPAMVWALIGLARGRHAPVVAWTTAGVLTYLTLGGRNLGEVARLWLLLMPPLLVAAGAGLDRLGADWRHLAVTVALQGGTVLLLQAMIQVVYPV